jgi:hypothetical protein
MANDLTGGHYVLTPMGQVLLDRFEAVKRAFDGSNGGNITLPSYATIREEFEDEIGAGIAELTKEDLEKIFSKSVNGTLRLIQRQIVQVQNSSSGSGYSKVKACYS